MHVLKTDLASHNIHSLKRYTIDNGNFSSNYFFTLFADSHDNIWFGNRGYGLFHIEGDSLAAIPLKMNIQVG